MRKRPIREQLDTYIKEKYGVDPEILCVKPKDRFFADLMMQQPGYLRGYPSNKWNWVSMVLDGTVSYDDICRWLDESYLATKSRSKNLRTPLPKRGAMEKL